MEAGLYRENLTITKPDLKIQPYDWTNKDSSHEVVLMAEVGPAICIDIKPPDGNCIISGIKVTCQGEHWKTQQEIERSGVGSLFLGLERHGSAVHRVQEQVVDQ